MERGRPASRHVDIRITHARLLWGFSARDKMGWLFLIFVFFCLRKAGDARKGKSSLHQIDWCVSSPPRPIIICPILPLIPAPICLTPHSSSISISSSSTDWRRSRNHFECKRSCNRLADYTWKTIESWAQFALIRERHAHRGPIVRLLWDVIKRCAPTQTNTSQVPSHVVSYVYRENNGPPQLMCTASVMRITSGLANRVISDVVTAHRRSVGRSTLFRDLYLARWLYIRLQLLSRPWSLLMSTENRNCDINN